MKSKIILAVVLLLGVTAGASAQTIGQRERNERHRITEGRRDGELTRGEAFRLEQEQRHINHDIYNDRRYDRHLSPRERRHIMREERRASHDIYRYKHNRYNRF